MSGLDPKGVRAVARAMALPCPNCRSPLVLEVEGPPVAERAALRVCEVGGRFVLISIEEAEEHLREGIEFHNPITGKGEKS